MLPMQKETVAPSANARPSAVCWLACVVAISGPNRRAIPGHPEPGAEQNPQVERPASEHGRQQRIDHRRQRENYREQAGRQIEAGIIGAEEIQREQGHAENHEAQMIGERKAQALARNSGPDEHDRARDREAPHARNLRRHHAELEPERQPARAPEDHYRREQREIGGADGRAPWVAGLQGVPQYANAVNTGSTEPFHSPLKCLSSTSAGVSPRSTTSSTGARKWLSSRPLRSSRAAPLQARRAQAPPSRARDRAHCPCRSSRAARVSAPGRAGIAAPRRSSP